MVRIGYKYYMHSTRTAQWNDDDNDLDLPLFSTTEQNPLPFIRPDEMNLPQRDNVSHPNPTRADPLSPPLSREEGGDGRRLS